MTIKLTEGQIQHVLGHVSSEQLIDFLADDVEKSVDVICRFIRDYVDSQVLQEKLKGSFPPIQMDLFKDN